MMNLAVPAASLLPVEMSLVMRKSTTRVLAAAVLVVGFTLPAVQPASAQPTLPAGPEAAPKVSAAMATAMRRDLHLTAEQVPARLAQEAAATKTERAARA